MAVVTLTDANNGELIEARLGDEIVLQLPENATTGYRWHIDRADGLAEKQIAHQQVDSKPGPNPQFGRGGIREFRFTVNGPATARLELKRWREWEGESSVLERFAVDIKLTG
jgi:inhibitor of cysteine peptidase